MSHNCQGGKKCNKIVVRRLPPNFTLEIFKRHVSPLPAHNYIYCVKATNEDSIYSFSRVYINFVHQEDIYPFKEKYDNYIFLGFKGIEYCAVVEFAPYQEIPSTRLFQNNKCETILSDIYYKQFLKNMESVGRENVENSEYNLQINAAQNVNTATPLLKYIAARKAEEKGRGDRKKEKNVNCLVFVNSAVKKSSGFKKRAQ